MAQLSAQQRIFLEVSEVMVQISINKWWSRNCEGRDSVTVRRHRQVLSLTNRSLSTRTTKHRLNNVRLTYDAPTRNSVNLKRKQTKIRSLVPSAYSEEQHPSIWYHRFILWLSEAAGLFTYVLSGRTRRLLVFKSDQWSNFTELLFRPI